MYVLVVIKIGKKSLKFYFRVIKLTETLIVNVRVWIERVTWSIECYSNKCGCKYSKETFNEEIEKKNN